MVDNMDGFHLSLLFLSQDLLEKPFPDSQIPQWALGGRKWGLNREETQKPGVRKDSGLGE